MKTGFGNFLGFSLACFLAGCSSVDTTAIIENNQSIYFGKKEKYRFVKSQKLATYVIGYGKSHGKLLIQTFNEKS